MSLINVERIKLLSTRSPWWCMIISAVLAIGLASLATGLTPDKNTVTPAMSQFGVGLGQMVIMVMAALAVTTEYRFNTIKTSFQAVPQRANVLLSKTLVVAGLAALVGEVAAFGSWAVGALFAGADRMALDTGQEWRLVAGEGLVYAVSAVIAIAVGILLRQSAAAIAVLILWPLLVENLVQLIPKVGDDLQKWAPFVNANQFINGGQDMGAAGADSAGPLSALSPWVALLYFSAWATGLLVIALFVTSRRDA
ncbi:MAG TPA: ABC transporter permease subunit [Kribbellaceae bacterium]|jgi:ABC-2 type transport system permease protein